MRILLFASFAFFAFLSPLFLSAQIPAGAVGQYPLDNSAVDISGNNNNGTLISTTATTNRFTISNSATGFNSGSSYGSLPRIIQDNFTVGFWFKTTMTGNSSTMWYGGNSLVNAEVCGAANDWGTSLINGGQVCMGIGNPDMTIFSTANYNDGNWHFVTAVRDETAGVINLYVDAAQVATGSGTNTSALNAPGAIGLGRDATFFTTGCGAGTSPNYTGSLDDVIMYNRALSSAEVTSLYNALNATALPLEWLSFDGTNTPGGIQLQWSVTDVVNNKYFEVEHSTDAKHFSPVDSLPDSKGTMMAGSSSYTALDPHPANGINYYRIEQVDLDGKDSWSKTIAISFHPSQQGFSLFPNPGQGDPVLQNPCQQYIRQLNLTDISGKRIRSLSVNAGNSSITIDTHSLSPGYYWISVEGTAGLLATLPFAKL